VGGVRQTADAVTRAYGADFFVAQKGSADLSFSSVTEEQVAEVEGFAGVERTLGVLVRISRVGDNPYFVTLGVEPGKVPETGLRLVEGALPAADATNEILLGSRAASKLDARTGDTITIDDREFRVVGVYKSDNIWEDGGAIAPLVTVQEVAGKPGIVTMVYVWAEPGVDSGQLAAQIEEEFRLLSAIASADEYSEVDQGLEILDAIYLAISALAIGIGAIGVMNTMIMSVYDRTREIGILRAVGWSDNRVIRMIISESLLLCVVATVVGALAGVLASRAVLLIPAVESLLSPVYTPDIFLRALVVALIVALVGAAYPVVRAMRLVPMDALRHE
jgi:putative ABC transport system permease protein